MDTCPYLLRADRLEAAPSHALSGLLERLRLDRVSCSDIARELAAAWGMIGPDALALLRIAAAADASGLSNSYHNPSHARDVAVGWANLAVLNNRLVATGRAPRAIERGDAVAGLCAAFGHDLLHDGTGNFVTAAPERPGRSPKPVRVAFRLENMAADHVIAIMRAASVAPSVIGAVTASILSTDPVDGQAALEQALGDDGAGPFLHTGLGFLSDLGCRLVASLLRDADLMVSAGLTAADHDRQTALLGAELGVDLGTPESTETFFAKTARGRFLSPAGALFLPQLKALQAVNRLRRSEGGTLSLAEAARRLAGS